MLIYKNWAFSPDLLHYLRNSLKVSIFRIWHQKRPSWQPWFGGGRGGEGPDEEEDARAVLRSMPCQGGEGKKPEAHSIRGRKEKSNKLLPSPSSSSKVICFAPSSFVVVSCWNRRRRRRNRLPYLWERGSGWVFSLLQHWPRSRASVRSSVFELWTINVSPRPSMIRPTD